MTPGPEPHRASERPLRIVLFSLHWVEYLIELGNALAARGHEVFLVVSAERVEKTVGREMERLLDPRIAWLAVRDYPTGLRDPRQLASAARILGFVRRARPDVLHIQDSTNGIVALCLPFWQKLPLVVTVHDVNTHPGRDSSYPARRAVVRERLRARADAVIVHGEELKRRYLAQYPVVGGRVHCIPHGCYGLFRHWSRPDVAREPRTILFFGRIELYKGLGQLLEAFGEVRAACPDAKLLIAGAGADLDRHRAALENIEGCELHAGYVPTEKVASLFQRAGVVVLPYIEGSQSGVTRIACPFGVPVVATDVGSIAESVRDGETGLIVEPGKPRELAAALIRVLTDDGLRRRLSSGATRMADDILGWHRVAEKQERVLRETVGRGRGRPRAATATCAQPGG